MYLTESYCRALLLLKKNEREKGEELLFEALDYQNDDPFLAIKLTPSITFLLQHVAKESSLYIRLSDYLLLLHKRMEKEDIPSSLLTRASLARRLAGLQPLEKNISIDLLDFFHPQSGQELFPLVFLQHDASLKEEWFSKLKKLWNANEGFFIGPALYSDSSFQDDWMRYLTSFPLREGVPPYYAALFDCEVPEVIDTSSDPRFSIISKNGLSLSLFKDTSLRLEPFWRVFHLVRGFLPGHSFSVQGRSAASAVYEDSIVVTFTYPQACLERDPLSLIGFYIDRSSDIDFLINGKKGLSFGLGDIISFQGKTFQVSVSFLLIKGEARVSGHIIPYSRPAKEDGGSDWAVFLRPIAVDQESTFTMTIQVHS